MVRLARITLYPIKALDGLDVSEAILTTSGSLVGDRRFAMVDSDGQVINGKRFAQVHKIRSDFDVRNGTVRLRFDDESPDRAFHLLSDRPQLEERLSDFLGFRVRLVEDNQTGFPDDLNSPGPTVVSSATLEQVAEWFGFELADVRKRFRANLELDQTPAFWEDRLFGETDEFVRFRIGDVEWYGTNPCQRCVVPSRHATTGEQEPGFAARFAKQREASIPAWTSRSRFDHFYRLAVNTRVASAQGAKIRVGDVVEILQCVHSGQV